MGYSYGNTQSGIFFICTPCRRSGQLTSRDRNHGTEKVRRVMKKPKNAAMAETIWGHMSQIALDALEDITKRYSLRIASSDLLYLDGKWYVTHSGLLGIARRKRCLGIQVRPAVEFCDPAASRWAFKATVYKSRTCKGFVGFGDADPANVSSLVHGAEMRVAETRAVNRALRKAYGIGICSVEELGSAAGMTSSPGDPKKLPPQRVNGKSWSNGPRVRDQLCQLIRQHQLDPNLV